MFILHTFSGLTVEQSNKVRKVWKFVNSLILDKVIRWSSLVHFWKIENRRKIFSNCVGMDQTFWLFLHILIVLQITVLNKVPLGIPNFIYLFPSRNWLICLYEQCRRSCFDRKKQQQILSCETVFPFTSTSFLNDKTILIISVGLDGLECDV